MEKLENSNTIMLIYVVNLNDIKTRYNKKNKT